MLKWSRECAGGEHCNVTYDCVYEGVRLGTWLNTQRQRFRGGTTKNLPLTPWQTEQMQAMIDAGKLWVHAPDDVWEKKYERPLNVIDPDTPSKVLCTTRIRGLVKGATEVDVGSLSEAEALDLLTATAGG